MSATALAVLVFCFACVVKSTEHNEVLDEMDSVPLQPVSANVSLVWMAPFYSGGGYCSEATAFVLGLSESAKIPVSIQQHGDSLNRDYVFGLSERYYTSLSQAAAHVPGRSRVVSVCHSEPGAWHISRALPQRYSTSYCPILGSAYSIGRTMFETDRIPSGWSQRLNGMREVWVPTQWQADMFAAGGVQKSKLHVVPEPVDTDEFRPWTEEEAVDVQTAEATEYLSWRVEGRLAADYIQGRTFAPRMCRSVDENGVPLEPPQLVSPGTTPACPYRFLFVGKWERRKGLDILLRAYYTAFGRKAGSKEDESMRQLAMSEHVMPVVDVSDPDAVPYAYTELYILTSAYHSSGDFEAHLAKLVKEELTCGFKAANKDVVPVDEKGQPVDDYTATESYCLDAGDRAGLGRGLLPSVRLLTGVPQRELPLIYRQVDALVQPSRGEGWGRPHVEAMATSIPVLATNWSGTAAFLNNNNGFPIKITGLLPIPDGSFAGHLQAEPDVGHLSDVMRYVVSHPDEATAKGRQARADMQQMFSPRALAQEIERHMHRVSAIIDADEIVAAEAAAAAAREREAAERAMRTLVAEHEAAVAAEELRTAQAIAALRAQEDASRQQDEAERKAAEAAKAAKQREIDRQREADELIQASDIDEL